MLMAFMSYLAGFCPVMNTYIPYKLVSFDVQNMTIITQRGAYKYNKLPNMFLVEERRIGKKYEIRLKVLKPINHYKRWE
jgi:hypothetical protein